MSNAVRAVLSRIGLVIAGPLLIAPKCEAGDCFTTGCPQGQVCAAIPDSEENAGACTAPPQPPPNCIAPCLWEARQNCAPVLGECTLDITYPEPGAARVVECNPSTGWVVETRRRGADVPYYRSYRRAQNTCYAEERYDNEYDLLKQRFRSNGDVIAVSKLELGATILRRVWCGRTENPDTLDPATAFVEDIRAPGCTEWHQQFQRLTSCSSGVPGSCAGL